MIFRNDGFLSSDKEVHKWHRGFYLGLKYWNPFSLVKNLEVSNVSQFEKWEDLEGQYQDPIAVGVYALKMNAISSGIIGFSYMEGLI